MVDVGKRCNGDIEVTVGECMGYFESGYSCAEAVFMAACGYMGIEDGLVPRVATAFSGGLSRTKSVCGALTGGAMALSVKYGRNLPTDDRTVLTAKVQALSAAFHEAFGSENCYELTGLDFNTPEGQAGYKGKVHTETCCRLVGFCIRKVLDELNS